MKICFVVEDIYPTLKAAEGLIYPNGRAVHFKHLGEALAKNGHKISYVTMDYGQPDGEEMGDFTVYKMFRPDEGVPGLRFLLTKAPKLLKVLERASADVYFFMCPDPFVAVISWFCRRNDKKFIYFAGSDKDFEGNGWKMSARDKCLFKYGLKRTDAVLCQNDYQVGKLRQNYGKEGKVLYNPMEPAGWTYNPAGGITWIANYRPLKRPEMFIELSKRVDDRFIMIGGRAGGCSEAEYRKINSLATNGNITISGPLDYEEADKRLSAAKLLINTSEFEGLSNTFLQAWRRGIPVVSFVDPDGMIKKNDLGRVVSDFEGLVTAVEELRKGITRERSEKIREFFCKTFASDIVASKFGGILTEIFAVKK